MIKSLISVITSAALLSAAVPVCTVALPETYTVNFLDLDGNPYFTVSVPSGRQIDKQVVSQIDTSKLRRQVDVFTQEWFSEWYGIPDIVTANTDVKPLTTTGTISLEKPPEKTVYYSLSSDISMEGLLVNITLETQTGIDGKGNYTTKKETVDISSTCSVKPETAAEAFASGDKASVNIFPINSDHPIGSYDISYMKGIADVNGDGIVTGSDATMVLYEYTKLSSDPSYKVRESVMKYGDMNFDGILTGSDATMLLTYYTHLSSDSSYTLDMFYSKN